MSSGKQPIRWTCKKSFRTRRGSGILPEPSEMPLVTAEIRPTPPEQRIEILDVLRGFAIFGILVVNMGGFKSPGFRLGPGGESLWSSTLDHGVTRLIGLAATLKFVTIFSFLFGVGFALQMLRAEAREVPFVPLYLRRVFVLLTIGLIHGFLIWWGDILAIYAVVAVALLLFRRCKPRTLLIWSAALFLLSFAKWELIVSSELRSARPQQRAAASRPLVESEEQEKSQAEEVLRIYSRGSFAEIMSQRAHDALFAYSASFNPSVESNQALRVLGLFLLGLYAGRRSFFRDLAVHRSLFRYLWMWGLGLGLLSDLGLSFLYRPALPGWTRFLRPLATAIGVPSLAAFYVSTLVLLYGSPAWRLRLTPLATIGRTALSNYLLQSVVCTMIFYSYGLGLYGRLGPAAGLGLSFLIFAAQVPLSAWWLRRFRFGPVEWVWRSLTYGRIQPMRL